MATGGHTPSKTSSRSSKRNKLELDHQMERLRLEEKMMDLRHRIEEEDCSRGSRSTPSRIDVQDWIENTESVAEESLQMDNPVYSHFAGYETVDCTPRRSPPPPVLPSRFTMGAENSANATQRPSSPPPDPPGFRRTIHFAPPYHYDEYHQPEAPVYHQPEYQYQYHAMGPRPPPPPTAGRMMHTSTPAAARNTETAPFPARERDEVSERDCNTDRESVNGNGLGDSWIQELGKSAAVFPHAFQLPMVNDLPQSKIGKFSGNPADWWEWNLTFRNRVHDNPSLTISQKLSLLGEFLGEEPKDRVFRYLWDPKFYHEALKQLQQIYGNPDLVIGAFLDDIKTWPSPTNAKLTSDFARKVGKLVQTFQVMGYERDLNGRAILGDITRKLPESMRKSWGRFLARSERPGCVMAFHEWIANEERSLRLGGALNSAGPSGGSGSTVKDVKVNATVQNQNHQSGKPPTNYGKRSCHFCSKEHHELATCHAFLEKTPAERLEWHKAERRCFRCSGRTGPNHRAATCGSRLVCGVCGRWHATILHEALSKGKSEESERESEDASKSAPPVIVQATVTQGCRASTYLEILPVKVFSTDGICVDSYAFLDPGSQAILIDQDFARYTLGLDGPKATLTVSNVAQNVPPQPSKRVRFKMCDPNDQSDPIEVQDAWTFRDLQLPGQTLPRDSEGEVVWTHARGLSLRDIPSEDVKILIGANCKEALMPINVIPGLEEEPDCIQTRLGWALLGGREANEPRINHISTQCTSEGEASPIGTPEPGKGIEDLVRCIEKFWKVEDLGAKYTEDQELSQEDRRALQKLERETKLLENGHYEVPMLWRDENLCLKNNVSQAEAMYRSLQRRAQRDPDTRKHMSEAINKYVEKGYARKLTPEECQTVSNFTHYMVYFIVFHPQKLKARAVFHLALKFLGSALNDRLIMGPLLTSTLAGLFLRVRMGSIVLSSDIEGMFSQVYVTPQDRDALRFLYSPSLDDAPDHLQMVTHVFGATCSPCCATYALRRTAHDNRDAFPPSAVDAVLNSFYFDDFLHSVDSEDEAVRLTKNVIALTARGGFKLTKWVSNSPKVLEAVSEMSELGISTNINLEREENVSRLLGVQLDVSQDQFFFTVNVEKLNTTSPTRRTVLSDTAGIFDPMGWLHPLTLKPRLLIQQCFALKLDWDQDIPEKLQFIWSKWVNDLERLSQLRIARKYWPGVEKATHLSVHYFGDASEGAYGACAYIRAITESGQFHTSLLMARSRLCPLGAKTMTLARLELQAATLSVRLATFIRKEVNFVPDCEYFYTDSMIVLQYLYNDTKRLKTFCGNRVAEILSSTPKEHWRHCPGIQNPADLITRGLSIDEMLEPNCTWFTGPDFLCKDESQFPEPYNPDPLIDGDPEVRPPLIAATDVEISVSEVIIDVSRFSKLSVLLRATAYCLRFCQILKTKTKRQDALSAAEVRDAKIYLMKMAQQKTFGKEIHILSASGNLPSSSTLIKYTPEIKNGILCVGGRLAEAHVTYWRHQIILHPKCHLTKLIVRDAHERLLHAGTEIVLTHLRQTYFIPKLRPVINHELKECRPCRRLNVQPQIPKMAPLPPARLAENEPVWTHTGVDLLGPIYIKQRRSTLKVWVAIFVCLTTRAIHLEVLQNMSTDRTIMAIRRMMARRGPIKCLYSDPGSNFIGANPVLREGIKNLNQDPNFQTFLTAREITWVFHAPKASHMNGAWEILVKPTKRAIRAVLKDRIVTEDVLTTVLCEAEYMINSRPLTYVGKGTELPVPLTPNNFLLHAECRVTDSDTFGEDDLTSRRRWRQSQIISQHLWGRWRKEYLPTLATQQKWFRESRCLRVGDVVLVVDKGAPRGYWPLARIEEVEKGRDGRVRVAKVKTKSGFLTRPTSQLCVLEEEHPSLGN